MKVHFPHTLQILTVSAMTSLAGTLQCPAIDNTDTRSSAFGDTPKIVTVYMYSHIPG